MFSIGQIWREKKRAVPKRKQTNKKQDKQTIAFASPISLIAREPRAQGNRRRRHVGSICCSNETKVN